MTAPAPRREERNGRLYALLRGLRERPEPTSGVRVGQLSYNETVVYDAIVGEMDAADATMAALKIGADRLADEVAVLVRRRVIDARSLASDALLDYVGQALRARLRATP